MHASNVNSLAGHYHLVLLDLDYAKDETMGEVDSSFSDFVKCLIEDSHEAESIMNDHVLCCITTVEGSLVLFVEVGMPVIFLNFIFDVGFNFWMANSLFNDLCLGQRNACSQDIASLDVMSNLEAVSLDLGGRIFKSFYSNSNVVIHVQLGCIAFDNTFVQHL